MTNVVIRLALVEVTEEAVLEYLQELIDQNSVAYEVIND